MSTFLPHPNIISDVDFGVVTVTPLSAEPTPLGAPHPHPSGSLQLLWLCDSFPRNSSREAAWCRWGVEEETPTELSLWKCFQVALQGVQTLLLTPQGADVSLTPV